MIDQCPDDSTRNFFKSKNIVQAVRQPNNILRQLTSAKFDDKFTKSKPAGTFKCQDKSCKICRLYLQECRKVTGQNGIEWIIPSHITCHSQMVIYFLTCLGCGVYSKVGKTNCLRPRTNNHISECISGVTSDRFDRHVYNCKKDHIQPVFILNVLMEVDNYDKLLVYEDYFHKQGFDVCNRKKATAPV